MTRFSFKTTARAKGVMLAVAEMANQEVGDLIHEYFYLLAKTNIDKIDHGDNADDELLDIFHEAIMIGVN